MATIEYSLFRVLLILPSQPSLLHYPVSRTQLFVSALDERAETRVRAGYRWHIGNVRLFSAKSGYFAIGRTTRSSLEIFDPEAGNFVETELETSPYTHCVFDAEIGFVGIAKKLSLAPTTIGIARRIEEVLSRTPEITDNNIRVELAPIPNPDTFLREIGEAYRVLTFSASFHGPNPIDADEIFQKPLAKLLEVVDGKHGKTELRGTDLNRGALQAITRSTAATGNEATAKIKREHGKRAVKIHLRGSIVGRAYEEEEHDPEGALNDLRTLYLRVRDTDAAGTN